MTKRELYFVNGELYHGNPGGQDMRPISGDDLNTYDAEQSAEAAALDAIIAVSALVRVSATATADGLTTGSIDALVGDVAGAIDPARIFVTVTSANADHIVYLPTVAVLGQEVVLQNGATGYELRPDDASGINGGTPAAADESAIAATTTVTCVRISATAWKCMSQVANGTVSATEASAA